MEPKKLLAEYLIFLTFKEEIGKAQKGKLEKCKKAEKVALINAHPKMVDQITSKELKTVETNDYWDDEVEYSIMLHRWVEVPATAFYIDEEWGEIEVKEDMIPNFQIGSDVVKASDYYIEEQILMAG